MREKIIEFSAIYLIFIIPFVQLEVGLSGQMHCISASGANGPGFEPPSKSLDPDKLWESDSK